MYKQYFTPNSETKQWYQISINSVWEYTLIDMFITHSLWMEQSNCCYVATRTFLAWILVSPCPVSSLASVQHRHICSWCGGWQGSPGVSAANWLSPTSSSSKPLSAAHAKTNKHILLPEQKGKNLNQHNAFTCQSLVILCFLACFEFIFVFYYVKYHIHMHMHTQRFYN